MKKQQVKTITIDLEELKSIISECFISLLKNETNEIITHENKLMTRKEVANLMGVSVMTIWRWVKEGKLREHRVCGSIRFKRDEISKIMLE